MEQTPASGPAPSASDAAAQARLRSRFILLGICAAFAVIRFPLMYRQYGGQDEEWYAVPGYTILETGIPQIPFAPARDLTSVFYRADQVLYALPPAYFYWQALFHAACGPGYFAGRLSSAAAAVLAILLVYQIGRRLYNDEATALAAAALYSASRLFYFPAMSARPDMACGAIGLAALLAVSQWRTTHERRWLLGGGALVGLGVLTHPFAVIYSVQMGLWVLVGRQWKRRLVHAGLFTAMALLVFAAWLPLILLHPEVFRIQFFNNVLRPAGPGLLQRLVFPWGCVAAQSQLFLERAGLWQAALLGFGLTAATVLDWPGPRRGPWAMLVLAWSSVYLLVTCLGTHPTKEYWCYPAALLFLCVARTAVAAARRVGERLERPALAAWAGGLLLAAAMAPGSGIRTWLAHLQNWSRVDYSSPRFVAQLLRELPDEGLFLVDRAYVFDFYLAGRRTLLANNTQTFFRTMGASYDYLIAGPCSLQSNVPQDLGARHWKTFGDPSDLFACFAAVYVPPHSRGKVGLSRHAQQRGRGAAERGRESFSADTVTTWETVWPKKTPDPVHLPLATRHSSLENTRKTRPLPGPTL